MRSSLGSKTTHWRPRQRLSSYQDVLRLAVAPRSAPCRRAWGSRSIVSQSSSLSEDTGILNPRSSLLGCHFSPRVVPNLCRSTRRNPQPRNGLVSGGRSGMPTSAPCRRLRHCNGLMPSALSSSRCPSPLLNAKPLSGSGTNCRSRESIISVSLMRRL